MKSWATFDPDRRYRYLLIREWDKTRPACTFVMLNPSTADETTDDATIRRCLGYARSWGCGVLNVLNLFALRATDPRELYTAEDPVGPQNDSYLDDLDRRSRIVVAWGAHGTLRGRGDQVLRMFGRAQRFGLTANCQPLHPLRLRRDAALELAQWLVMRALDGVVHWAAPRDGGWDTRCGLAPEWMARDHTISCAACDRLAGGPRGD